MANCAKCGAELIGSGKFCATCGAPAPQPTADVPPNTIAGTGSPVSIATGGYQPPSQVNPFAATASPSNPSSQVAVSKYGAPPVAPAPPAASSSGGVAATDPASSSPAAQSTPSLDGGASIAAKSGSQPPSSMSEKSQVSPLAVSNALSQRNAFKELGVAVAAAQAERGSAVQASEPAPPPEPVRKKPGTQLMGNAPVVPQVKPPAKEEGEPPPPKKPVARTVAMGFNRDQAKLGFPPPASKGAAPSGAGAPARDVQSAIGGAPQSAIGGAPQSVIGGTPQSVIGGRPHSGVESGAGLQQPPTNPNAMQPQSVVQPSAGVPHMPQSMVQPSAGVPHMPQSMVQPSAGVPHMPQSIGMPQSVGMPPEPSGAWNPQAMQAHQPSANQPSHHHAAYGQPAPHAPQNYQAPYAQPQQPQVPTGPGGWGWNAPMPSPAPAAAYPYPFAYAPGSRVYVTWSNGQRYPATVNQVSGSQCLVVFPDGQQHWVEMQYLSPG
jgi:hypothetical protein